MPCPTSTPIDVPRGPSTSLGGDKTQSPGAYPVSWCSKVGLVMGHHFLLQIMLLEQDSARVSEGHPIAGIWVERLKKVASSTV